VSPLAVLTTIEIRRERGACGKASDTRSETMNQSDQGTSSRDLKRAWHSESVGKLRRRERCGSRLLACSEMATREWLSHRRRRPMAPVESAHGELVRAVWSRKPLAFFTRRISRNSSVGDIVCSRASLACFAKGPRAGSEIQRSHKNDFCKISGRGLHLVSPQRKPTFAFRPGGGSVRSKVRITIAVLRFSESQSTVSLFRPIWQHPDQCCVSGLQME
jgi:hypothetical protein